MNGYSLTVFFYYLWSQEKKTDNAHAIFFFFLGGGGGGLGANKVLWEMRKWRISFNITRIEDWQIQSQ